MVLLYVRAKGYAHSGSARIASQPLCTPLAGGDHGTRQHTATQHNKPTIGFGADSSASFSSRKRGLPAFSSSRISAPREVHVCKKTIEATVVGGSAHDGLLLGVCAAGGASGLLRSKCARNAHSKFISSVLKLAAKQSPEM